MEMSDNASAHTQARIAGGLWLAVIITGVFATLLTRAVYVPDNPLSTAARLLASESEFRLAFVLSIISFACYVGVTVILCVLMNPVSRTLALLTGVLGVTGTTVGMATSLSQLVPLLLLKGSYLTTFTSDQLRSLALTSFLFNAQGILVSWVFFGLQMVTVGYLIARSNFLPRVLGVLLAFGGSIYVIGSFVTLVWPNLGGRLFPILGGAAFIGEGSLAVWLLVKGVNLGKWEEYSARAIRRVSENAYGVGRMPRASAASSTAASQ